MNDALASSKPIRIWFNEAKPHDGRIIYVHPSREQLVARLMDDVGSGLRCFVCANSKEFIHRIAQAIEEKCVKPLKALVISSETTNRPDVRAFIGNPRHEALKHDVILASPSIGTGIDITFADNATKIDVVYGFCQSRIGTHLDFDQQLARVRHPGSVHVWIEARRFNFETNLDVVRDDILKQSLFHSVLKDFKDNGDPIYVDKDDPLVEMAALILSQGRASKNDIRQAFLLHKEGQGHQIEFMGKNLTQIAAGEETVDLGARLRQDELINKLVAGRPLRQDEFTRIRRQLERGHMVLEEDRWAYERVKIEVFYRQAINPALVVADELGRRRGKIALFEACMVQGALTLNGAREHLEESKIVRTMKASLKFLKTRDAAASTLNALLSATPLHQVGQFFGDVIVTSDDLASFVEFVTTNKGQVETALDMDVRADLMKKPMRQLNRYLEAVGQNLVEVEHRVEKGKKRYFYALDKDALREMQEIVERRRSADRWRSYYERHWPEHFDELDDEDDDG